MPDSKLIQLSHQSALDLIDLLEANPAFLIHQTPAEDYAAMLRTIFNIPQSDRLQSFKSATD